MIGFPLAALPPIVATTETVGTVTGAAAQATGLAQGTPVVCGTSDTAAETYCAGMVKSGIGVVNWRRRRPLLRFRLLPSPASP